MRTVQAAFVVGAISTLIGCGGALCDPGWQHIPGTHECIVIDAGVDGAVADAGELPDHTGSTTASGVAAAPVDAGTNRSSAGGNGGSNLQESAGTGGRQSSPSTDLQQTAGTSGRWNSSSSNAGSSEAAGRTVADATAAGTSGSEAGGQGGAMVAPAPSPRCGDGHIDVDETCDGTCPTKASCASTSPCLVATYSGDASTCDAKCELTPITTCAGGDGCCASGCNYGTDTDCSQSCGDGVVSGAETCEPTSKTKPCPTSCDDGNSCTADVLTGMPTQCNVACSHQPITAAVSGDGCCPAGANANNDNDCKAMCGNGVKENGETCDGSDCPASCTTANACTPSKLVGDAAHCNAVCVAMPITTQVNGDGCCPAGANATNDNDCSPTCGNGVVESGEICDRNCPTSCGVSNGCASHVLMGSAAACNAVCSSVEITAVKSGDGCCPAGADATSDGDCNPVCGNDIVEPGEKCDGNCPKYCTDEGLDLCSHRVLVGTGCNVYCQTQAKSAGVVDGCCPAGATCQTDPDCKPQSPGDICLE